MNIHLSGAVNLSLIHRGASILRTHLVSNRCVRFNTPAVCWAPLTKHPCGEGRADAEQRFSRWHLVFFTTAAPALTNEVARPYSHVPVRSATSRETRARRASAAWLAFRFQSGVSLSLAVLRFPIYNYSARQS